ncbi:MAG: hypothetical protein JJ959_05430 [Nisaea sp.]|uniref:hypothetical protein n=1 Tax=Nisaea sp. TaxID=2024842 RepID=UPI001B1180CF|nr:hypothetical protein [Nisaea sp.]MBO6559954.1 hypothetical protein [Nisaea sp.]
MMRSALFLAGIAIAGLSATGAQAADAALQKAIAEFGAAAGRIEASVPFCGGPPEEAEYFVEQIKGLSTKAGAGPVEWAAIRAAMQKAKSGAAFTGYDCTDEGARAMVTEMLLKQQALATALN